MATKPIPVRIPLEWLPRLDAAAKRLGTNRSRLIGFLAQTFVEHFEKRGVAELPVNWKEILTSLDGRRSKSVYPAPVLIGGFGLNEEPNLKTAGDVIKKVVAEAAPRKASYPHPRRVKKSAVKPHTFPSEQLKP